MLHETEEILILFFHSPDKKQLSCGIFCTQQKFALLNAHRVWQLFFRNAGNILFWCIYHKVLFSLQKKKHRRFLFDALSMGDGKVFNYLLTSSIITISEKNGHIGQLYSFINLSNAFLTLSSVLLPPIWSATLFQD